MDPTTAWETMIDETNDVDERIEAAHALRDWINAGGFHPEVATGARAHVDDEIAKVLRLEVPAS